MNDVPVCPVDRVNAPAPPLGRATWAALGLGLSLCVPSIGVVQRYLGNGGTAIYLLVGAAALVLLVR